MDSYFIEVIWNVITRSVNLGEYFFIVAKCIWREIYPLNKHSCVLQFVQQIARILSSFMNENLNSSNNNSSIFPFLVPLVFIILLPVSRSLTLLDTHISEITQHLFFRDWLISVRAMSSSLISIVQYDRIPFSRAEWYSIVSIYRQCVHHIFFIHLSVEVTTHYFTLFSVVPRSSNYSGSVGTLSESRQKPFP